MKKSAQFFVLFAAVCWGTIGIYSRQLSAAGLSSIEIATSRCVITALCLLGFLAVFHRDRLKVAWKDLWVFVGMGSLGIVVNNIFYFITIELVSLSTASILVYTAPYMVIAMSAVLFKEKITLQKMGALMVAFFGCILTIGLASGSAISLVGIMTGLFSAFGYALYSVLGRIALRKYDPFTVTAYTFTAASLALIPLCNVSHMVTVMGSSTDVLKNLLILGIFLTVIPFVSFTRGLRDMEASKASILAFVEPLTASVAGMVVLGELLSVTKVLGILLIFVSLGILNTNFKRKIVSSLPARQ